MKLIFKSQIELPNPERSVARDFQPEFQKLITQLSSVLFPTNQKKSKKSQF